MATGALSSIVSDVALVTDLFASFVSGPNGASTRIRNALNQVYEDAFDYLYARVPDAFTQTLSGSLTSGVAEYTLSASSKVTNIRAIIASSPSSKVYVRALEDEGFYTWTDTSKILYVFQGENTLKLRPVPGASEDGETFRIIADLGFTKLSEGNLNPTIVTERVIVDGTISKLLKALGESSWQDYSLDYEKNLNRLLDRLLMRYEQQPAALTRQAQDFPYGD